MIKNGCIWESGVPSSSSGKMVKKKKSRFLGLQTILGLASLIYGHYLARANQSAQQQSLCSLLQFSLSFRERIFSSMEYEIFTFLTKKKLLLSAVIWFRCPTWSSNEMLLVTAAITSSIWFWWPCLAGANMLGVEKPYAQNAMFPHDISTKEGCEKWSANRSESWQGLLKSRTYQWPKKADYQYYTMGSQV